MGHDHDATPDLFIGVVSHVGSRFADSQGEDGLAAKLRRSLSGQGMEVAVAVNTENLLDPSTLPVTRHMAQQSLGEQLRLARTWSRYLDQRRGAGWWAMHGLRRVKRSLALTSSDTRAVTRLLNIELSHLDLMRRGLKSGAPWVLVLEDDAGCTDPTDCAHGLAGLMQGPARPAFVNVSESFALADLGISHLLRQADGVSWQGSVSRQVLAADRPVTNTVCAILYEADFLRSLVATMEALPMTPVVPIDWKLNLALMQMHASGGIEAGACWLVEPAPIVQRSMTAAPPPG